MKRPLLLALGLVAAAAAALTPAQIDMLQAIAKSRLQELNLEQVRGTAAPHPALRFFLTAPPRQLEALYSLLDDDGSGSLTVHEMIDLFVRGPPPPPNPRLAGP